ncbi:hypothetical protein [Nocardioides zeae]|uniref:Uncharacterized protein n=1 Tax=Nocardioides zeae TaxID=1457234 RepID=A0AAJ1U212_9ACTN|nr:hypothetical protein [Nocardioides zeae]MDQ1106130.1 hypothetical protein [Nocardioides zeae]
METIETRRQGHVRVLRAAYAVVALLALAHGVLTLVERWHVLQSVQDGAGLVWFSSWTLPPLVVALAAAVVLLATLLAARARRPGYVAATAALLVPLWAVSPAGPWEPAMPGIWAYAPTAWRSDLSPDPFLLAVAIDSTTVVGAVVLLALVGRTGRPTPSDVMRPGAPGDRTA